MPDRCEMKELGPISLKICFNEGSKIVPVTSWVYSQNFRAVFNFRSLNKIGMDDLT